LRFQTNLYSSLPFSKEKEQHPSHELPCPRHPHELFIGGKRQLVSNKTLNTVDGGKKEKGDNEEERQAPFTFIPIA
jgi:hypothetical protein